ncbi:hypothetical protein FDI24_gp168 [Acidovorax phage ACP17]|uniref:Macro domain-containing protein n=1 Tax=Acidovorax phage ACP17 TaxID=2010329 RepID=A0A218M324_9CAUD|nr:hypothetical protein FDI24_gp168 [Acidovorax phage ACP17]ASD50450.1 hypothetical protein [Acidovorax phage ACP17]
MNAFHQDGSRPAADQIFVFGSNLSGIHGGGAARAAYDYYGAEWGVRGSVGMTGHCYAIPTKAEGITHTLDLDDIRVFIDAFVAYTKAHPNLKFFVTRVGCGLAGLKDEDIAPMFKGAVNCDFAEEWKPYLE